MNAKQIIGLILALLGFGYTFFGLMNKTVPIGFLLIGIIGIILIVFGSKSKK